MILRFCSGSVTPASCVEEALLGVDHAQVDVEVLAEDRRDLLALALAQQAVVDEDAGQPVADRAVDQRRRDATSRRRPTARRSRGRRRRPARGSARPPRRRTTPSSSRPRAPQTPNRKLPSSSAPRGVCTTSGWNCTPWIARAGVREPRQHGSCRDSPMCAKPGGSALDAVAVRHPDRELLAGRDRAEHALAACSTRTVARPYSRLSAGVDLAAEQPRRELRAVADAEDRHAELEERRRRSSARPAS